MNLNRKHFEAFLRILDGRIVSLVIIASFSVISGLCFHSGDEIAMRMGSRSESFLEVATFTLMIGFQLWMYPIAWLGNTFHFPTDETITASIITSLPSIVLLYLFVRWVYRRSPHVARGILCLFLFCSVAGIYAFDADMRVLHDLKNNSVHQNLLGTD
jgi:hypothetical protein